ncbi:MAG TPA: hypothetical protein VMJ30_05665, partial [Gemmatimonadales bacterium]|nr:hypothetical protein [Gemmatimonadales bacterium]
MTTIERDILRARLNVELERFADTHPRSRALAEKAASLLVSGVPMPWMVRWAGAFPIFVHSGAGPNFVDVDNHRYIDFCLGDTGAMSGHAPGGTVRAIEKQAIRGLTFMLPNEDAIWVADELRRRFGLPAWQFTLTATDANRAVIRLARRLTGRSKI